MLLRPCDFCGGPAGQFYVVRVSHANAAEVLGDKDPYWLTELHVCGSCYTRGPLKVCDAVEARRVEIESEAEGRQAERLMEEPT